VVAQILMMSENLTFGFGDSNGGRLISETAPFVSCRKQPTKIKACSSPIIIKMCTFLYQQWKKNKMVYALPMNLMMLLAFLITSHVLEISLVQYHIIKMHAI
jgi:hypothetical protein